MSSHSATISIPQLQGEVKGRVIGPQDADYDDARTVFPGGIDRRPAAIVRVADATDISRIVTLAGQNGFELAVRSGGHSTAGHGVTDGGVVIDLAEMRALDIDVDGRTAWAETGLTAAEYSSAAAEHGLATGFGDTGSVGIGGITLGGGIGYLVRKYGLTIDDLRAVDIVTADGNLVRADAESHPDLFWAVRGGGGNFGVATRFQFRLHPVDAIVGGMLLLPATPQIIQSFIAEAEAAPLELSTIANVMPAPPMPFVPAEHHGQLAIMALMCFAGPAEAGERAMAPFRALATPIVDMLRPMPYPEIYPPDQDGYHPMSAVRTMFIDSVDATTAESIVENLQASSAMMAVAQLRVLGGAMSQISPDATAFAHRDRRIMATLAGVYQQPDEAPRHEEWVSRFAAALRNGEPAAYVNFLGDEGEERVRQAYPGSTWDRLRSVKAQYDPTNLFRLNQNIPPSGAGT
jgi:FAD/FMN-containing dehydrogenase